MHKLGFQIPQKTNLENIGHEIRKFQMHDSTSVDEVLAWVNQFTEGYIDIVYDNITDPPFIKGCERKGLCMVARYEYTQIIRRQFVKAITWRKYSSTSNPDGGRNYQIL